MPPSNAPVALSRAAGFLGGAATLGDATYVAITDATSSGSELLVIRAKGDRGAHVAALPFHQVTGVVACGSALLVAGSYADGLGGAILAPNGRVIRERRLGTDASFPTPVCDNGEAVLVSRRRSAGAQLMATEIDSGRERAVLEEPAMITFAAAAASARTMIVTRVPGGLRIHVPDLPPRALREGHVDMPALCAAGDGFLAAWAEDHVRSLRVAHVDGDGMLVGDPAEVVAAPSGEQLRSVQLACQDDGRFAVYWQTATFLTDPLPGDRTTPRLWVAFGDAQGIRARVELPAGGPAVAAWRGDDLVVVHGASNPYVTTLTWPG